MNMMILQPWEQCTTPPVDCPPEAEVCGYRRNDRSVHKNIDHAATDLDVAYQHYSIVIHRVPGEGITGSSD